ncbi:lactate utilization protein [Aurantimonas sp. C2-6-R+9]|uniref:LutC/YkgG family protein n=1 Tax=unclassified Aurantimonas TaxID=2638230 RepID=UPI002E19931A|nr:MULTISPECIES: lactate utilization protein [unclassified Aurantimonas]MEC5291082.1 lactate utilization protein [Aurantimonas sp. C2-3-R2]MEC5381410.1 lactate utilization protein [Aurantimonas sp. C2-6-R+9]MEC5412233.1 lactate utilization protein [Aurantimonas sp. C2-4-R8]
MSGSTRDAVLGRIRRSNGARPGDPERQRIVEERLAGAPKGIVPQRGQLPHADQVSLFVKMAEKADATTARIASYGDLPAEVSRWLRDNNFPADLRLAEDPRLAGADFGATALTLRRGASDGNDLNALSHAESGIAETGTLVLVSGAENPTSLNFLPENHIVVVKAEDIAGDMEATFPSVRQRYGKGEMPRSLNFVTGPSRSGDIEQTLLLGAHGPRALHIVVVG